MALHHLGRARPWPDDPAHCDPFTYYDSANDLAALLAHLGVQQAVLAGMSQGGYLSLRCALTHPEVVRALVLIDTQALQEDPQKMAGHEVLVKAWLEGGLSDDIAAIVAHTILGDGWADAPVWQAKWKQVTVPNLLQCFTTLGSRDDISERLGTIRVPALVVHGALDHAIDLSRFDVRFRNDTTGAPAYPPAASTRWWCPAAGMPATSRTPSPSMPR